MAFIAPNNQRVNVDTFTSLLTKTPMYNEHTNQRINQKKINQQPAEQCSKPSVGLTITVLSIKISLSNLWIMINPYMHTTHVK